MATRVGYDGDGMNEQDQVGIVEGLDYALQPIVNIHTGVCFGYEALLRAYDGADLDIQALFDGAFAQGTLLQLDLALKKKAVEKFVKAKEYERMKLFYNLDNRILSMSDSLPDNDAVMARAYNLQPGSICFELSEKHDCGCIVQADAMLSHFRYHGFKVAIDDFGTGFSGLQLLYNTEPDFIKIDRFFISGIETDSKKKLFVSKVVHLAHILGIFVIAEGVETEKEYRVCKEIGFDFLQGYFVQRPTIYPKELEVRYAGIENINRNEKRERVLDHKLLSEQMDYIEPICLYNGKDEDYLTDMAIVFDAFRKSKAHTFLPVLNGHEEPIGIIRENDIKEYVYSRYGKDLLMNKSSGRTIKDFVAKCPLSEINTRIENILEMFSLDFQSEGVVLTEDGRYIGFLSSKSLLKVINEKNLAVARDQNPLTRLPGNNLIKEYIDNALEDIETSYMFAYLDFDNFKPFNDRYGFRIGDRAILMFTDILNGVSGQAKFFRGHLGGDDFFAGFCLAGGHTEPAVEIIKGLLEKFRNDVASLYEKEDRERGCIVSADREGNKKTFPLLSASAAILHIRKGERRFTVEEIGVFTAELKKLAKASKEKIASLSIPERTHHDFGPLKVLRTVPEEHSGMQAAGKF